MTIFSATEHCKPFFCKSSCVTDIGVKPLALTTFPLLSPCLDLKVFIGAVTLDLFPKAPLGKIAWLGFALGFDHFHV